MERYIISAIMCVVMVAMLVQPAFAGGAPGSEWGYDTDWLYWSRAGTKYGIITKVLSNTRPIISANGWPNDAVTQRKDSYIAEVFTENALCSCLSSCL